MKKTMISIIIAIVAIVGIAAIITTTTSATYEKKIEKMETKELQNWFHRKDTIFTKEKSDTIAVAIFEHYEYELNPHHRKPNI